MADQRFGAVRLSRGYDMQAVDAHLDHVQDVLRARHGADAVAAVQGHATPPRHRSTWWIYLIAVVLVAVIVVFALTQL